MAYDYGLRLQRARQASDQGSTFVSRQGRILSVDLELDTRRGRFLAGGSVSLCLLTRFRILRSLGRPFTSS